ncbi:MULTISPECIES: type I restriction endonuclease subunit R [unclassified Francisella]|uniref:type I restriction endonuclease subunit R n=1 Tax=unclassified Francisella TaxID=2610885 RepID=UPI002E31BB51|nr:MULTISPECIES: type I restriction endonuclease subunit R [unclassified Francisella]MED7818424.1 type I restriction endonuclease subunit R [Francisella sp. 19S2-4]MED7829321.1 type I restriction endonuclease subunit R [Francisella sp. 19S2-10]
MCTESELQLENKLIKQLVDMGYEKVHITNEEQLIANLKSQLEKHNEVVFSDSEFPKILNELRKGSIIEKAQKLREKYSLIRDDGTVKYIEFLDVVNWCQNFFQVTHQISQEGKYKNRYDVTLLINGFPLVQIELKKRGLEIKEAFNQVNRYQRHSFGFNSALFNYVQIFVISNGVNTKYYANNKKQSFKQTFYWADENNKLMTNLAQFTKYFLEKCHISKMICKYIVISEVEKCMMVLRPYQYYAVEKIIDRVKNSNKNGYIWHTTGSGKTLTSFKAAQILVGLEEVDKVVFVVDRNDLDSQTTQEFNKFAEGSVDSTDNTKILVDQFLGKYKDKKGTHKTTDLIVTTIQKLNTAINKPRYLSNMETIKDKKIVFIFDECHRSQFGKTHTSITKFFTNCQLIGFTGTPILEKNATVNQYGKRTTVELFDERLHKYVITDAISDGNVLKFAIEYIQTFKEKDTDSDEQVENIDTQEVYESDERISKVVDYIIANHSRKTHSKKFNAIFCVGGSKKSTDVLIKYYEQFKAKKHDLKVATIFSFCANEDDKDANGINKEDIDIDPKNINAHTREKLDEYIEDFNKMFNTKHSTKDSKSFQAYYNDVSKKTKKREIDILLVVNMFLTGFDSKTINTIYVDKNLKYHGLIQAFSRTNRILDETKSHGNVVCFRNLKHNTDEAIALFSNKEAEDVILMKPYEEYIKDINKQYEELNHIAQKPDDINTLVTDQEKLEFIKAFRNIIRTMNILTGFTDFDWQDIKIPAQLYEDFKSKYYDLYDDVRSTKDEASKVSILKEISFDLELIQRDEITISYILQLLAESQESATKQEQKDKQDKILKDIANTPQLRSKKELIRKFMETAMQGLSPDAIEDAYDEFMEQERQKEVSQLVEDEKLKADALTNLIDNYLYEERKPRNQEIVDVLETKPTLKERKTVVERVFGKVQDLVERFYK